MKNQTKEKTKKFFNDLNIKNLQYILIQNLNWLNNLNLEGIPTTILLNKEGNEFARIIGEIDFYDKKIYQMA